MTKISAVIISCNEASQIANYLKRLSTVVDKIILVDCGSKDGTQEIAKSFGAKVFLQSWLGYGEQKNLGISKASYNYILSIDCNEKLMKNRRMKFYGKNNWLGWGIPIFKAQKL